MSIPRRSFLASLAAAATWPLAAHAQQPADKVPTVGILGVDAATWGPWAAAFVARLRELGWIEGRTVAIEYRWDEASAARATEIADEFVRLKVDAILANGKSVAAVKQATATIPIVFPLAPDPVAGGLVASLARPGGNITGLSLQQADLAGKRLELIREVVPALHRVAIMFDAGYPQAALEAGEVHAVARTLGLDVAELKIRHADDIAPAFEALKTRADALYLVVTSLINLNNAGIITQALNARLPTIFSGSDYVRAGALMSYGPKFPALFERAAEMVDKILHGAKPADIPVEQPTKFELVLNLKTAKAIGVTVPPNMLAVADEVIE